MCISINISVFPWFVFGFSFHCLAEADINAKNFTQKGAIVLKNFSLFVEEEFENIGALAAEKRFDCVCGTIKGDGFIKGSTIKIIARDFKFRGAIECDKECVIITSKPFDHALCTFQGEGKFDFVVDENACAQALEKGASVGPSIQVKNFAQAGVISHKKLSLHVEEELENSGAIIAEEQLDCVCGTIKGDGIIKSPIIKLIAQDFQFKGIIECDKECVITTSKPFDHSLCSLQGEGKFDFVVDADACAQALGKDVVKEEVPEQKPLDIQPVPVIQSNSEKFLSYVKANLLSLTQIEVEILLDEMMSQEKTEEKQSILSTLLEKVDLIIEDYAEKTDKAQTETLMPKLLGLIGGLGACWCLDRTLKVREDRLYASSCLKDQAKVLLALSPLAVSLYSAYKICAQKPKSPEPYDQLMMVKGAIQRLILHAEIDES